MYVSEDQNDPEPEVEPEQVVYDDSPQKPLVEKEAFTHEDESLDHGGYTMKAWDKWYSK